MTKMELVNGLSKAYEDEIQEAQSYDDAMCTFVEVAFGYIERNSDIDLDTEDGVCEAYGIIDEVVGNK